ncbi:hypothetical protein ACLOJK_008623 [Asimina triloba]
MQQKARTARRTRRLMRLRRKGESVPVTRPPTLIRAERNNSRWLANHRKPRVGPSGTLLLAASAGVACLSTSSPRVAFVRGKQFRSDPDNISRMAPSCGQAP